MNEDNPLTVKEINTEIKRLFEKLKETDDLEDIKIIKSKIEAIKHILKTQLLTKVPDIKKEIII